MPMRVLHDAPPELLPSPLLLLLLLLLLGMLS
jgi:hypothetical protein